MKFQIWGLLVLSFIAGLLIPAAMEDLQLPRSPLSPERASPSDWVSQDDIEVYKDHIRINVENAKWASFADSNSMDPVLDAGSNGLQLVPTNPEQLQIGDVITYDHQGRKIIHRIVDINVDAEGYYFTVKGDNNSEPDPIDVRFKDIERVLFAVVY